jgi:hypothetical protein
MPDQDDSIKLRPTRSEDFLKGLAEESREEAGEFSGVVIPTVEGRRHGSPGVDLMKKELRDQSRVMKTEILERIIEKDFSDGEVSFLKQAAEEVS